MTRQPGIIDQFSHEEKHALIKEVNHMRVYGEWPTHTPIINTMTQKLAVDGYSAESRLFLVMTMVSDMCIRMFSEMHEEKFKEVLHIPSR